MALLIVTFLILIVPLGSTSAPLAKASILIRCLKAYNRQCRITMDKKVFD